jgi:hypothetical protein
MPNVLAHTKGALYMVRRLQPIFPALLLLTLLLVIFRELAFTDWIFGRGDTYVYFYPYWHARDTLLRAGQLPLWTPNLFTGAPLLANPQVGALYPLNWLTVGLDAPNAIKVAVLLHVAWAAVGTYWLGRGALRLSVWSATVMAAVFAFGGYLGAHTEQINQLQGLAWFPWAFGVFHRIVTADGRSRWRDVPLLGIVLALQFLAGHTQTVFINGVGLALYALLAWRPRALFGLSAAGAVALVLAAPQLIPTLELIGQSGRSGGLSPNAALSFSLPPLLIGRGLLPSYDAKLFTEFIGYIGVAGVFLATIGLTTPRTDTTDTFPYRRVWGGLLVIGLLLALGAYNPLNWWIVRLPGFGLFRVPARWLALVGLAGAALVGLGLERPTTGLLPFVNRLKTVIAPLGVVAVLMFGGGLARYADPVWVNGTLTPSVGAVVLWGGTLFAAAGVWVFAPRWRAAVGGLLLLELVAAAWVMPYNDLVPPEIYNGQRFTITQMLALTETDENGLTADGVPPPRLLSISGLFFDPGDKAALSSRYQWLGMTLLEERYAFVAAKLKETLSPNLPLTWGIPTVDGFGGGLLPTRNYVELMAQVYPPDVSAAVDGRLRENLALEAYNGAYIPPDDVLAALDVGYIVVDKVYDVWHEGVNFDTTFVDGRVWDGTTMPTDRLYILYTCPDAAPCDPPVLTVDGVRSEPPEIITLAGGQFIAVQTHATKAIERVTRVDDSTATIIAVTAVNSQTDLFVTLNGEWVRVLSSDIKLYARREPFNERAALYAGNPNLDDLPPADALPVTFVAYHPTRVEMTVDVPDGGGVLLLRDAYYPGWQAISNGEPVPLVKANVNFRAILLPQGENRVIVEYKPVWLPGGFVLGGVAWVISIFTTIRLWRRQHRD